MNALEKEVREAYADCSAEFNAHMEKPNPYEGKTYSSAMSRRNLNFRASKAIPRDEAIRIMNAAIADSYNEFRASLLELLPEDAMITIARKNSVCIYVKGDVSATGSLQADDIDYNPFTDETCIWWD